MSSTKYEIWRDCCTTGNCDKCHGVTPYRTCLRVMQMTTVNKKQAERCEKNWKEYKSELKEVA